MKGHVAMLSQCHKLVDLWKRVAKMSASWWTHHQQCISCIHSPHGRDHLAAPKKLGGGHLATSYTSWERPLGRTQKTRRPPLGCLHYFMGAATWVPPLLQGGSHLTAPKKARRRLLGCLLYFLGAATRMPPLPYGRVLLSWITVLRKLLSNIILTICIQLKSIYYFCDRC